MEEFDQFKQEPKSMSGASSFLNALTQQQAFVVGLVGGIMAVGTIGSIILLAVIFSGDGRLGFGEAGESQTQPSQIVEGEAARVQPKLVDVAKAADLNVSKWSACVKDKKFAAKIQADEAEGAAAGGQGTPFTLVIAPNGDVYPIEGAYPYQTIEGVIKTIKGEEVAVAAGDPPLPAPRSGIKVRPVDPKKEVVRGNANAKITLVEFSDYECPFCKRFHATMNEIIKNYGDEVRWTYRQMPLDGLHRKARIESLAAECARDQGKFWEFSDQLFAVTPSNDGMDVTL